MDIGAKAGRQTVRNASNISNATQVCSFSLALKSDHITLQSYLSSPSCEHQAPLETNCLQTTPEEATELLPPDTVIIECVNRIGVSIITGQIGPVIS